MHCNAMSETSSGKKSQNRTFIATVIFGWCIQAATQDISYKQINHTKNPSQTWRFFWHSTRQYKTETSTYVFKKHLHCVYMFVTDIFSFSNRIPTSRTRVFSLSWESNCCRPDTLFWKSSKRLTIQNITETLIYYNITA